MSVATKTRIALITNAEGIASTVGKLYTELPTNDSADPTVTRANATATRVNSAGNIENVVANKGRISYELGINKCPNLLVERSRTNLLSFTEDFTSAVDWVKSTGGTGVLPVVTANAGIAPNGTLTADRIQLDRGAGNTVSDISLIQQQVTVVNLSTNTISIWLKSFDSNNYQIAFTNTGATSGLLITVTPTWQRFTFTGASVGTLANLGLQLRQGVLGITGQSQTADILAWGAQLETAAFATSYIPRLSSAAVTANADVITKTGISDIIPQTKGGLFFDGYLQAGSLSDVISRHAVNIGVDNNNRIQLYRSNNLFYIEIINGGVNQMSGFITLLNPLKNKRIKVLVLYDTNNVNVYFNDILVLTDNSVTLPSLPSLFVGQRADSGGQWDGLIKAVAVTDELDATEIDKIFQYASYADMASEMLYETA